MKLGKKPSYFSVLTFLIAFTLTSLVYGAPLDYPLARIENNTEIKFGVKVDNPYKWLENGNSIETKEWVKKEVLLTNTILKSFPEREILRKHLTNYLAPKVNKKRTIEEGSYLVTQSKDQDNEVISYQGKNDKNPRVILDMNTLPSSHGLHDFQFSKNEKIFAYTISPNNNDENYLQIKNVETGKDLPNDKLIGLKYSRFAIAPDGKGVYYVYYPVDKSEEERAYFVELKYHKFGTLQKDDIQIYKSTDKRISYMRVATLNQWLFIADSDNNGVPAFYAMDLTAADKKFQKFNIYFGYGFSQVNADYANYLSNYKGYFYAIQQRSINGSWQDSLVRTSEKSISTQSWEVLDQGAANEQIRGLIIINDRILWLVKKDGQLSTRISKLDGSNKATITTPKDGISSMPYGHVKYKKAFFTYSSLSTPPTTFSIDTETFKVEKTDSELTFDSSRYVIETVTYPSKDGTLINMILVRLKTSKKNSNLPTLLYVYGGFNTPMYPNYSPEAMAWLEAGGMYGIMQVRGGGEKGKAWHMDGKRNNKQHTYDDVIAGAEYLINNNYTNSEKLALMGISNGGLTVAAVLVQRPDLFKAGFAGAPVIDMLRFNLFGAASEGWVDEYGDPKNEIDFKNLLSYSPYHNVKKGVSYPSILFDAPEEDDRVDPMHARKMAAILQQNAKNDGAAILLRSEKNAGHSGGASKTSSINYYTDMYSFFMQELGMSFKN